MNNVDPAVRNDYLRWSANFGGMTDGSGCLITLDEVLRSHYLLMDYFIKEGEPIGVFGPRDKHLLPSAVCRQVTGYGGKSKWSNDTDRLASLFYGLIMNHPFHDGNKRTALLTAVYGLWKIHRVPTSGETEFEKLALRTAAGELSRYKRFSPKRPDPEVAFIAEFLRKNSRKEDKRYYVVTYAELDTILRKHGCSLENPSGNYIHVMRPVTTKGLFGIRSRTELQSVLTVGFPRWTAEVNQKALKSVLRATGLTPENGIDSQVLFSDAEPMSALIDKYREPLRRLRDK